MKLAELQNLFWSMATGHQNDSRILKKAFCGTSALPAKNRMQIYANMYLWRQIDALRQDFPKLANVMGAEEFYAFAEAYISAYPSVHPSLSKLGRHVTNFLKEQSLEMRPDLIDLSALEWARAEVFEESACATASLEILHRMATTDFDRHSLTLIPALRVLKLNYDVPGLWQEIEDEKPISDPKISAHVVVVWRKEFDVFHVGIDPEEAKALDQARAGKPMGIVCEAFEDKPDAIQSAFRAIQSWFVEGWVADPSL